MDKDAATPGWYVGEKDWFDMDYDSNVYILWADNDWTLANEGTTINVDLVPNRLIRLIPSYV